MPPKDLAPNSEYIPTFEHQQWFDGISLVQAEPTTDDPGFNARMFDIQADLEGLAGVSQTNRQNLQTTHDNVQSLHQALESAVARLTAVEGRLAWLEDNCIVHVVTVSIVANDTGLFDAVLPVAPALVHVTWRGLHEEEGHAKAPSALISGPDKFTDGIVRVDPLLRYSVRQTNGEYSIKITVLGHPSVGLPIIVDVAVFAHARDVVPSP